MENTYHLWLEKAKEIPYLWEELDNIKNNSIEISDRFWKDLSFGTGGLRGLLGAGSNRMNLFTVGKATQGLVNCLLKKTATPSIAIAYDTRNFSREFAQHVTSICAANGVKAHLFNDVRPTPMLSFAVRQLKADAGVAITASHNPKEYNGYKVYGSDGGQITDEMATLVLKEISACDIFRDVQSSDWLQTEKSAFFQYIPSSLDDCYYEKVKALSLRKSMIKEYGTDFNILYTPLHGAGNIPVRRILKELGFPNVAVVKEQELPDGNFPTTPYPNPEEPAVYQLAIKEAQQSNPDLIFATDPDADRIGVLAKNGQNQYAVLSGNQVGVLLTEYIIKAHEDENTMPLKPAVIKTIVTSDMGKEICKKHNISLFETLTGFKYIGELVEKWAESKEKSFLLGFEESYGYLAGDFVRDKDAVIAAALIAEMALYYKTQNRTLFQALEGLYKEYRYYKEELISVSMPGQEGQEKIANILNGLRVGYEKIFGTTDLCMIEDYLKQEQISLATGKCKKISLPPSNVLKFIFQDASWIVFRPSGTEPKVKVYISATGDTKKTSIKRLQELKDITRGILK